MAKWRSAHCEGRGSGGQSFEDERGIEFAARQQVGYLCSQGHSFEITMSVEADVPGDLGVPALWRRRPRARPASSPR